MFERDEIIIGIGIGPDCVRHSESSGSGLVFERVPWFVAKVVPRIPPRTCDEKAARCWFKVLTPELDRVRRRSNGEETHLSAVKTRKCHKGSFPRDA